MVGKKAIAIAQRELGSYFTTWLGYLVAAAALVTSGVLFNAFALGGHPKLSVEVLRDYFYYASGISMVAGLFIAMRLIAEERQTQTLPLLLSSPVTEREIVYGKFLSAVAFLACILAVSLYMPALIFVHGKVSLGHIAAGYTCLFLIGAAAIAITLFASALAPNQLLSGVLGTVFLVIMLVLWMLVDVTSSPFREVFGYMALHNKHFTPFARGVIHSQDVVYYLSVCFFFLECSVRTLEARRWRN